MRTIVVELSPESCLAAIEELKRFKNEIKPKLEEVCRRVAEIGVAEARARLALSNGNTSATIEDPIKYDSGYKVVMSGADVYFVEFGTGDMVSSNGFSVSVPVYPGSYSEQNKQQYSTYGFWWYAGEKLQGTPAYMPMFYAGQRMREEIPRIVKEVFGQT